MSKKPTVYRRRLMIEDNTAQVSIIIDNSPAQAARTLAELNEMQIDAAEWNEMLRTFDGLRRQRMH